MRLHHNFAAALAAVATILLGTSDARATGIVYEDSFNYAAAASLGSTNSGWTGVGNSPGLIVSDVSGSVRSSVTTAGAYSVNAHDLPDFWGSSFGVYVDFDMNGAASGSVTTGGVDFFVFLGTTQIFYAYASGGTSVSVGASRNGSGNPNFGNQSNLTAVEGLGSLGLEVNALTSTVSLMVATGPGGFQSMGSASYNPATYGTFGSDLSIRIRARDAATISYVAMTVPEPSTSLLCVGAIAAARRLTQRGRRRG